MRDSRLNVMLSSMSHGVNLEIHATESIRETWKFKRVSSIYREFRLAGDLEIHATTETPGGHVLITCRAIQREFRL